MSESLTRCPWVDTSKPDYVAYHDLEWGVPMYEDIKIFEFLILESAQAGLSWYTILKKRENYREAFANFDPKVVATFDEAQVEQLMENAGIVRNRRKIEAAINNAQRFLEVQAEFGSFAEYIWGFVGGKPKANHIESLSDYPVTTKESDALAKDLKKRGFKFLGSTTIYAHMQATGMVNDHSIDCFRRAEILEAEADN
ncbi:DNA-3-methyladenine glycosylase [Photobacterium proteolyticum]|uniref:DNA-3-methyladenine glycosylase I n=1 Tax=Photobacterium proteolyticum TaxID=1903952 RepID=A0A1Q9G773_9GAMM|nr:DNA-3-methyladenine glycosylase I [Photobacterium proteolyticum]OLQ70136.1 DNA-3-methyladenine glycosylase [Photobacterium proteolyticum]